LTIHRLRTNQGTTETTMQLTNTTPAHSTTYSRNQLMAMRMRRGALPGIIEIPSNVLNRIHQHTTEHPVARRLNFDNIHVEPRVELPPIFISDNADVNDNEVRFGSLNSEPLEPETPQR